MLRTVFRWMLAIFFVVAGVNHFMNPQPYLAMMPKFLPQPEMLHLIAGAAEIAAGVGILIQPVRRISAWAMLMILVAVFPANIYIAIYGWEGFDIPQWVLWSRLPFQVLFMFWVWWTCLAPRSDIPDKSP